MQSIEGIDEHNLYPVHESSTPPPSPEKYWQVHYLTGALQAHLTDAWIMSGSCLYYLENGQCVCVMPAGSTAREARVTRGKVAP